MNEIAERTFMSKDHNTRFWKRRQFLSFFPEFVCAFFFFRSAAAAGKHTYAEIRRRLEGRQLWIIPYSHNDWAWTHTRAWQADRAARIVAQALDEIQKVPEYRFFVDTWNELIEPFVHKYPERVAEFCSAVRDGKIAICGGTVCNQHPGWMEAESLVRDMILGRRFFRRLIPDLELPVMVHNDVTPGSSQMPQLLTLAGYRAYRFFRPDEGLTSESVPRNFVWRGLDGTEILVSRGTYGNLYTKESLGSFQTDWEEAVVKLFERELEPLLEPRGGNLVWVGRGSDDSLPLRSGPYWDGGNENYIDLPEFVRLWNQKMDVPMKFATPVEFFKELEGEPESLPRHEGVLDATMWTYWYGLNGNRSLRRWRTLADQALLESESFWSCAAALGEEYPAEELTDLWHQLLKTYSHAQNWLYRKDYAEQLERVRRTLSGARQLRDRALRRVAAYGKVRKDIPAVFLFNPLPWERTEVVQVWAHLQDGRFPAITPKDASGNPLAYQIVDINRKRTGGGFKEIDLLVRVTVPALGYATVYFEPSTRPMEMPPHYGIGASLDTEFATVFFSKRGIDAILDKASGTRYSSLGNVHYYSYDDVGKYHSGPITGVDFMGDASVRRVSSGPLRSSFLLEGTIGAHSVLLSAHLYPHAQRIHFDTRIDSAGGSGHFMAMAGLPGKGRLAVDVDFGVEERDVSAVAYEGFERERKNVFWGSHWADWSDGQKGMTLVGTTGEKGYQLFPEENLLGHFLLMTIPPAPAESWERFVTKAREGKGKHRFDYQCILHSGDWRQGTVVRRALEARFPVITAYEREPTRQTTPVLGGERSFLSISSPSVQLSAFYQDDGRYVLRIYESAGVSEKVTVRLPVRVTSARAVDFHSRAIQKDVILSEDQIEVRIEPWEIMTLVLEK